MSVKLADTLSPMSDFPVAMADGVNIVKEDGSEKSLQSMYEDGELGGESLPTPVAEDMVLISKDVTRTTNLEWAQVHKSEIGDIPFVGTHDEWDSLSLEEKAKYKMVNFTDDYTGGGGTTKWTVEEIDTDGCEIIYNNSVCYIKINKTVNVGNEWSPVITLPPKIRPKALIMSIGINASKPSMCGYLVGDTTNQHSPNTVYAFLYGLDSAGTKILRGTFSIPIEIVD